MVRAIATLDTGHVRWVVGYPQEKVGGRAEFTRQRLSRRRWHDDLFETS